jgi:hypothetical protein
MSEWRCEGNMPDVSKQNRQNFRDQMKRKKKSASTEVITVRETRVKGDMLTYFNPEEGLDIFLRNVGNYSEDNMAPHHGKVQITYLRL